MNCNLFFVFQFICFKNICFGSFRWGIIPLDFVSFPFKTSKSKNDINYIKYKFSHRFGMVCKWLNMYYSKIKIITFSKVITMSIWIILNNLVQTCRECNLCHYPAIILCIHPTICIGCKVAWSHFHSHMKEIHTGCAYANPLLILRANLAFV
jgi:hypothetical protein